MSQARRWTLGGGLASGKSLVRRALSEAGVATIDADQIGHAVLTPHGPAFSDVAGRWPQVVRDGEIDRKALADVVFSDAAALAELEALTHPHIFDRISAEVERIQGSVVVEMPLLHPSLGADWRLIVVDCRDETRLQRAVTRGMYEHDARARMAAQPSREQWLAAADVVVPNHRSPQDLESTIRGLLRLMQ